MDSKEKCRMAKSFIHASSSRWSPLSSLKKKSSEISLSLSLLLLRLYIFNCNFYKPWSCCGGPPSTMVSPLSSSSAFLNAGWFLFLASRRRRRERRVIYSLMLKLVRETCKFHSSSLPGERKRRSIHNKFTAVGYNVTTMLITTHRHCQTAHHCPWQQ